MNGSDATERARSVEAVAGLLAAAAIAIAAVGLAYRPVRLVPFGIFFALLAAGMGGRHRGLAMFAVFATSACFVVGMTIAVITENPIF